ncbi:hypothetical protein PCANC_06585 [Puccinia coronata f. sp. avenae]|uniref:Uncharacterized protein n=1 Tax=Puccinia coronata f. sp. avenae TaxID=200324 RepID=A0A2N5VA31_9BASI|nr:hypothetical protein PCANC_06585 [Puccinia coronata f. sp. avenae]
MPPLINQLDPHREFVTAMSDPARLPEICKRFDSNTLSQEMDQIASELFKEIIYLSLDYIGNTIRCAPHLTIIGCHKNGTAAAGLAGQLCDAVLSAFREPIDQICV